MDFVNYVISILISLLVGLLGFVAAYKIFDWLTPGVHFADQLKADNRSVAIFLAGLFVGLGLLGQLLLDERKHGIKHELLSVGVDVDKLQRR